MMCVNTYIHVYKYLFVYKYIYIYIYVLHRQHLQDRCPDFSVDRHTHNNSNNNDNDDNSNNTYYHHYHHYYYYHYYQYVYVYIYIYIYIYIFTSLAGLYYGREFDLPSGTRVYYMVVCPRVRVHIVRMMTYYLGRAPFNCDVA